MKVGKKSGRMVIAVSFVVMSCIIVWRYTSSCPRSGLRVYNRTTVYDPCCNESKALTVEEILRICSRGEKQKHSKSVKCDCQSLLACKLVVVTGISNNHFEEATDFIVSIQTHMPGTPILVYNLGLSKCNKVALSSYCQVTVRNFIFSKYPRHAKYLATYAWKPLMVSELYQEIKDGVILYCDASIRLQHSLNPLLPHFSWFPIIPGLSDTHLFISTTHDGMMKYLRLNKTRKEYASIGNSLQSGAEFFWFNQELGNKFIKYWADCALHQECISPQGSSLAPCNFTRMKEGVYACHRYDQAAYNAILTREFGFEFMKQLARNSTDEYFKIKRHPTSSFKLNKCN